ncbi:Kinesin light chain [Seminavis robusta]|uniref:Kinesin light chain n=1 Tax=Seminavis robusta TaxID=568900 RepID=A0A9N8EK61_9STRA|nr:Kinesin light chain [Seminavis robusta]|eukprot:Sro1061_g236870.1 Kinesin light chain (669) ;mRNA; r:32115-34121
MEIATLEASNTLFCQGREKDALHLLEESTLTESPPDLYLEEEGDIGPRAFRLPSFSRQAMEASVTYNKALIHHARNEFVEAMRLYEQVVLAPALLGSCSAIMVLKMRAHNNLGQIFYMAGISEIKALEQFSIALQIAKSLEKQQPYSLDIATVLSNWCRVQWMSGDVSQMVYEGLHEILRLRTAALGWDHPDVASAHYNLGVTEYAHNDGNKAVGHLMKYLRVVASQAAKTNNTKTDLTLDPIPALIYILLIKNEDREDSLAQELVRGLRTLQEKRADAIMGQQPQEIASVLNFIGTLLFHQRDFDHALLFFQEELRLEEGIVAENTGSENSSVEDISVSVTCNNIARILQELQRLPEAKCYYYRSLMADYGADIQNWSLDSKKSAGIPSLNHVVPLQSGRQVTDLPASTINLYSTVFYNLGLIHDKQGSYKEAIYAFQMSLSLRRVMLGPDHADVACLLYNIGVLQMEQQFLQEATQSLREALRIRRAAPSSSPSGQLNDCHVVKTLQKLASLHKAKGNIQGALEAQKEIFQIQTVSQEFESVSLRHKDMAATTREMAELHHAVGDLTMAVQKAQEAVAVMRSIQSALSATNALPEFVACMEELVAGLLLLGSLKHEISQPEEARAHYREASTMIQRASSCFSHPTELNALQEVTQMLSTCHCAPEA